MKQAHVICCNDSVEFACCEGTAEDAEAKLEELAKKDYEKWLQAGPIHTSYEDYRGIFFWHIRTVPCQ